MPQTKQYTPAELAALEQAFSADPASDAYRPLTEAYLAMGRFMEAMVVCKKGVKAHPGDVSARLLLSRVYAEQGKDRKALEEAAAALQERPGDPAANRAVGVLHLKLGEKGPGEAALLRAHDAAPGDGDTLEAMKRWGVAVPAGPRQARPPAEGIPVAPRVAPRSPGGPQPILLQSPVAAPPDEPPRAPPRPRAARRNEAYARELAEKYSTQEFRLSTGKTGEIPLPRPARRGGGLKTTLLLGVVLLGSLAGWYAYTTWRKARDQEIARLLKEAGELIAKDSYTAYKQAAQDCEQVLDRAPDSLGGHAYLAYVSALRWGEHGEGDVQRDQARRHLEAAQRGGTHSHAIAADAYLRFFGGDARGAIGVLEKVLKGPQGGTSGLLYGALGIVQMQTGDLDGARESLTTARKFADRDVRVNWALAEQYRRRGAGFEPQAIALFDQALRPSDRQHVPSLIGSALLISTVQGQLEQALALVEKAVKSADASPRQVALAQVVKAGILFAQGKGAEAAREEQQALLLDPQNPDIHDLVGKRRLAAGDASAAVESFRKAVELDPQRIGFYEDLADALVRRRDGGARQAVEALRAAAAKLPGNPRLLKLLGDAYRADGDAERARAEYEKAISAAKRYPEARVALAGTYSDRKEWAKALAELDRAAREYAEGVAGGAAQVYVEMAEIELARGGRGDAVEDLYQKALKSDASNCAALFYLGKERADRRGRRYDRDLAKQMLGDYLRACPRGSHAAEARRLAGALR